MQDDEQQSRQKRITKGKKDKPVIPDTRVTEEGSPPNVEDDVPDVNPNRFRTSSIRLRDPLSIQTTGQQTARRVSIPDPVTGRPPTPSPGMVPARSTRGTTTRETPPVKDQRSGFHWLLYVGVGMIAMLALWVVGSSALAWGLARYNDLRYGYPRTFQIDAVVGHGDDADHPSHFIAVNLHRHIIIVEFMAGNPAKAISYSGPYLFDPSGDLTPVTLEFRNVSGGSKPDMLIHIQDQTIVFVNDGTKFRPQNNNDHIHL